MGRIEVIIRELSFAHSVMKCTNSLAVSYLFSSWRSLIYFAFCCAHTWPTKAASWGSHWSLLFNSCISSYCFAKQISFLLPALLIYSSQWTPSLLTPESDSTSIGYIHISSKGMRNIRRNLALMAVAAPCSATCKSFSYPFTTTASHCQIHRSQSFCFKKKQHTALFPTGRNNNIWLSNTDEQ